MCSALSMLCKPQWPHGVSQSHAKRHRKKLRPRKDQAICSGSYPRVLLMGLGFRLKPTWDPFWAPHFTLQVWSNFAVTCTEICLLLESPRVLLAGDKSCHMSLTCHHRPNFNHTFPKSLSFQNEGLFKWTAASRPTESWHQDWASDRSQIWIDKNGCGWLRLSGSISLYDCSEWASRRSHLLSPTLARDTPQKFYDLLCLFSLGNLSDPSLSCVKETCLKYVTHSHSLSKVQDNPVSV